MLPMLSTQTPDGPQRLEITPIPIPTTRNASIGAPETRTWSAKSSTSRGPGAQKDMSAPQPFVAPSIDVSAEIAMPYAADCTTARSVVPR